MRVDKLKQFGISDICLYISGHNVVKMKEPKSFHIQDGDVYPTLPEKALLFLMPDYRSRSKLKKENHLDTSFIIECLRNGIPKVAIDNLLNRNVVSRNQLSHILHISSRQLNRYEDDDRLSLEQSSFLYELSRLYVKATDILGDEKTANTWLNRPNMAVGDQSPIDLLDTVEGFRMVEDLLSQIEYGFSS